MKKSIIGVILFASLVYGDFIITYNLNGQGSMSVAYKDDKHIKITTKIPQEHMQTSQLIVGDKHYLVTDDGKHKNYIDMNVASKQMGELGKLMGMQEESNLQKPTFKVLKKLKNLKVAGLDAQEWLVEMNDNGNKRKIKVVVTNDKDFVDALKKLSQAMQKLNTQGQEQMFSSFLDIKDGYGVVSADGISLKEFSIKALDGSFFALPNSVAKKSQAKANKRLRACALKGTGKKSTKLAAILKKEIDGWKLIEDEKCLDMMGMVVEGAVYKKNNDYIRLTLSANVEGENGLIAKYRTNNLTISDYKRGKFGKYKYQMAHVALANEYVLDIKLPNAIVSIDSPTYAHLDRFAKELNLDKFKAIKKSSPEQNIQNSMQKAMQEMLNQKDMNSKEAQEAAKMLQEMFGK